MDIALTPADAGGNPEMADAAVQPQSPPTILREDYAPFAWLVPTTRLEFVLGLEKTRVTATLDVQRNPDADPSPTIRLNGDGLALVSLECDGGECEGYMMDGDDLVVTLPGEKHTLSIVTELDPSNNSQLMGLYASNGMLCTQCEAEGFRRITFFPDRPDVLSTYTVRIDAPEDQFPILLANGNRTGSGSDPAGPASSHADRSPRQSNGARTRSAGCTDTASSVVRWPVC